MAKIHTVEWTPAMLSHPTTQAAMRADGGGVEMERFQKVFGRVSTSDIISGIPGSETNHFEVPYSLTEEFTVVYRMHPLIPDDFSFRSVADGHLIQQHTFRETTGLQAHGIVHQVAMPNLFYSFGTPSPGPIPLPNSPLQLNYFERPDGFVMDL